MSVKLVTLYNCDNTLFDRMVTPLCDNIRYVIGYEKIAHNDIDENTGEEYVWYSEEPIYRYINGGCGICRETLVSKILLELGGFEVVYPDVEFMKFAIMQWSRSEIHNWEKLDKTLNLEYNPIENYNRTEIVTDEIIRDVSANLNSESTGTTDSETNGSTSNETAGTNTKSVKAFNDTNFIESEQHESAESYSGSNSVTSSGSANTTTTTGNKSNEKTTTRHTNTTSGNIGVTTTQQMIESERQVAKFNLYDYITESFKNKFCIMVY